jgi:hypothetical protein
MSRIPSSKSSRFVRFARNTFGRRIRLGALAGLLVSAIALTNCKSISDADIFSEPQSEVTISSVVAAATGQPVTASIVSDSIRATLTVQSLPNSTTATAEVSVDSRVVCRQQVTGASPPAPVQVVCPINTAQLDTAAANRGNPVFPNGPHMLSARLVASGGNVLAAAAAQALTFVNRDTVTATYRMTRGPVTNGGITWRGGDLTVTATPAIFSNPNNRIARVTITVTGVASASSTDSTAADGFTATFAGNANPPIGLGGVEGRIQITALATTASGAPGPIVNPHTKDVDNRSPRVRPWFVPPDRWLNRTYDLQNSVTAVDSGSGGARVMYSARVGGNTINNVTSVRGLPETNNNNAIQFSFVVTDTLGNDTIVAAPVLVGNDTTPPVGFRADTAGPTLVNDRQINPPPGSDFGLVTPTDASSGLPTGRVFRITNVRANVASTGPATCLIGIFDSTSNQCTPQEFPNSRYPVSNLSGYQIFTGKAQDIAYNRTPPVKFIVLNDFTNPTVTQTLPPGPYMGGQQLQYHVQAMDDIDLGFGATFICFDFSGTPGCLPVSPRWTLGSWGPANFETSISRDWMIPVITGVERTLASFAPEGAAASAIGVLTRVTDQANRVANATGSYAAGSIPPPGPLFSTLGGQRFQITSPTAGATVGNSEPGTAACPANVPTSIPITIEVGRSLNSQPLFSRVILSVLNQNVSQTITMDAQRVRTDTTATQIVDHYRHVWTPNDVAAQTNASLSAFGVSTAGAAWLSRSTTPIQIIPCGG